MYIGIDGKRNENKILEFQKEKISYGSKREIGKLYFFVKKSPGTFYREIRYCLSLYGNCFIVMVCKKENVLSYDEDASILRFVSLVI